MKPPNTADHVQGNPQARVILLEYGDYECPFCVGAEPPVRRLVEGAGAQLRFVFRHFPLVEIHPRAELAAEAAEAAAAQGRFWDMHRLLFGQAHHPDAQYLAGLAATLGLDMNRYRAEMADRVYTQRVQEHRRAGEHQGVRTTPAFFLDGVAVDVSGGFDRLEAALKSALAAH
jgi:protein-disulfide isomerase